MLLPKLFNKREDGKLQQWQIEVAYGKGGGSGSYRTISGMVGGKLQTSEWTYTDSKNIGKINQTEPIEQALKEARAKWDKRVELGDREDASLLGDDGIFFPMLAKPFKKYEDKIVYPVYSQPKMDGMRIVGRSHGFFSREGKPVITMPHIQKVLKELFKHYPGLVIDGEGYADKLKDNFHKIISLIKKTKPTAEDLIESAKSVQYHVYDCKLNDSTVFSTRSRFVAEHLKDIPGIVIVRTTIVESREQLDALYEYYLDNGYEGQIIRVDEVYQNKRTPFLLKRKEFVDEEFTILDVTEGEGSHAGLAATMTFKNKAGKFKAGCMGSVELREFYLKNKKDMIGKQATVRYTKLNEYGIPYFAKMKCVRDYE